MLWNRSSPAVPQCYSLGMRLRLQTCLTIFAVFAIAAAAPAAPPIELELVTERGLQITAPQQWLQLFAKIGVTNVRIRTASGSEQPAVDNRGTAERPRFHVVGVLKARNEVQLPGGTFRQGERQKLADYFARLSADGAESMTAERGRFGLTEKEFTAVHADLAQPLNFITKDQALQAVLKRVQQKLTHPLTLNAAADQAIRTAPPVADDVSKLTVGTGLAIILRNHNLALQPIKEVGQGVELRIVSTSEANDAWPIGWESQSSPRETAPMLFESLNVEIAGYTLTEAIDAIAPRLKLPIYWDHAALAKQKTDPATIQVHLPRTRTYYKRILDRVLAQARLHSDVRVDEAGTAFIWITR
jgi:hypothetical protein